MSNSRQNLKNPLATVPKQVRVCVVFFFPNRRAFPGGFFVFLLPESKPGSSSIAEDICDMKSKDYGMAELEEWVAFFEEKGCEEWAGVAHLRIDLQTAYTMVGDHLQDGSEEKEAMLRKALALGEELKKFKKHPEDPAPWLEGTHRVARERAEMVGGLVDEAEKERLERDEQERRVKRMRIIGRSALGNVWGDWVLGGVAAAASYKETGSPRMN